MYNLNYRRTFLLISLLISARGGAPATSAPQAALTEATAPTEAPTEALTEALAPEHRPHLELLPTHIRVNLLFNLLDHSEER